MSKICITEILRSLNMFTIKVSSLYVIDAKVGDVMGAMHQGITVVKDFYNRIRSRITSSQEGRFRKETGTNEQKLRTNERSVAEIGIEGIGREIIEGPE